MNERAKAIFCFLALLFLAAHCPGQGTLNFKFEGQTPGTQLQLGTYSESGMQFQVIAPGGIFLSGGGIAGYPDNGSGYLNMLDGDLGGVRFNFSPLALFNLVSFDAAEWHSGTGPATLQVIGYKIQIMGPIYTVTNYFTLDGINDGTGPLQDFETLHLDSSFMNVFQVDIPGVRFAMDNVAISGVPEPSVGALIALATFSGIACSRLRRKAKL